jgi:hypothetical protein
MVNCPVYLAPTNILIALMALLLNAASFITRIIFYDLIVSSSNKALTKKYLTYKLKELQFQLIILHSLLS